MGGSKQKQQVNSQLNSEYAQNTQDQQNYMKVVNTGLQGSTGRADDMYNSMYGGYKKFIDGGANYDPTKYGDSGSGGGGGGGADPRFGDVESSYRNFMQGGGVDTGRFNQFQGALADVAGNGGWDANRIKSMDDNIGSMKNIASDPEIANRFRGNGVFDEFAKTGGYSDQDISNIRARSNSVIPAYYDTAKNEAGRMASVQGGYGPGQSAMMARMSRDQARGAAAQALDTEVGIKDQVNQGRQWGAGNVSSAEQALQGTRMNALTGASNAEANMVNSIAQNRTGAASAGGNNEIGMQGVIQKGKMFGTSGLEGMAESAAARSAAAGAAASADAKWRAQFDREGQQFGLEGMRSLYGDAPGEVGMYLNAANAGRNTNNSVQGRINEQMGAGRKGVDWAKWAGVAATAAMAASDRELKENIEPINVGNVIDKFKQLEISTWTYKGSPDVRHVGPMAQDMQEIFGVGDGKTIALVDVMGLLMLLGKAVAEKVGG